VVRIRPGVLAEQDVRAALDAELAAPPQMLPQDSTYPALTAHAGDAARWVHDRLVAAEFVPTPEETVGANKAGHGIRPIAVWDIPSRIAYRSFAQRVEPQLPPLQRSRANWQAFQRKPLDRDGRYIVAADIAACYQNLDHGLVLNEIAVQTGDHSAVDALGSLLREATGRTYGLPQQSRASDVLAEAFLARLERSLIRRRLAVDRYNDDFRLTCDTWGDVVRSLEVLEEEARLVGLTVNDMKTITWGRMKYADHLDASSALRQQIADEAELDLTDFDTDTYGGVVVVDTPDTEDVEILAAVRVLDRWSAVAGRGRVAQQRRAEHRAVVELLPYALSTLRRQPGTLPQILDHCMRMLRYERTMTPAVAMYLLNRDDDTAVIAALDGLLRSRSYLNGWQTWWLQQPVARLVGFATGIGATRRLRWARRALASAEHTPVLRVEAAQTLARHGQIQLDELLGIYDRSSDIVRPVLAGAVALLKPGADVRRAIVGDSRINEWAYDWAVQSA
jgi:RNA-directed DNA polymerase